jgi:Prolyl oligopeptidase family
MKKSLRQIVIPAAVILGIAACGHNNDDFSGGSTATPGRGALLQSPPQIMATYAPADLLTLLGLSSLGQILLQLSYSATCTVTVYHIEYQTVDPVGNLTPASGALMLPSGGGTCQSPSPIILYAHGTQADRNYDIAALNAAGNDEGLITAAVFAAKGYIVVAPNYVGYDASTLSYHPYLDADQQSKDMIDALAASRSALPTMQVPSTTDNGKLFITGYSQGGFVAMATHRAMQAAGSIVTAAAPLSGPYALAAFGDAVFEGEVNASAVENLTLLAASYQNAYGNLYTNTSDIFAAPYASDIATLLPSTTALSKLESNGSLPPALFSSAPPSLAYAAETPALTPANLASVFAAGFGPAFLVTNAYRSSYLQDAAASPDGGFPTVTNGLPPTSPSNALRQALKRNDLRSWGPTAPVLLCGGNSDPTVFYFDTQLMQDYWTANSPTSAVTVLDVDSAVTSNDPYASLKTGFAAAELAVRVDAIASGATDGGDSAVLADYHARLVPPFCLSAAKSFFDTYN